MRLSNRRVLKIALPIMLSNATVPLLGAVDTGVVGQLGAAAPIGAVGVGAIILGFVYWSFGALRMGTTGMAAQARGARDDAETGAILMRALMVALAAGAAFVIAQGAVFRAALALSPASVEVETLTRAYLQIRIWGAPATIGLYALNGWLIGTERTGAVLALQLWMNGLNIALDLWFALGLGWGVEGVAIATLIAETSGAALGLWLCRAGFAGNQWRDWGRVFDRAKLARMAAVNGDIMVRSLLLQFGFAFFLFQSAREGDLALAANQILLQFMNFTAYALDGFAFAAEALVGVAFGARDRAALRRAARLTSLWGLGCVTLLAAAFAVAGGAIIDAMTTAPEVRAMARDYLFWMAAAPLVGLPAWMFDGIFIGATRARDMRNAMLQSVPVYLLAWAALTPVFGVHGLWAAMLAFFAMRGVTLGFRYPALERAAAPAPGFGG